MCLDNENEEVDNYEQGFTGTRDLGSQQHEADLVFHVPAHKASSPPGNQETDALVKVHALATELSADTAVWVHRKSGHS